MPIKQPLASRTALLAEGSSTPVACAQSGLQISLQYICRTYTVRQLQLYALFENCFNELYRQPELRVRRRNIPEL